MEPEGSRSVSGAVPDEAYLTELANEMRAGIADAEAELRGILYPGVCFLLQRRGARDVEGKARRVLGEAMRRIQEDNSLNGNNLASTVRRVLQQIVSEAPNGTGTAGKSDLPSVEAARKVLEALSPVERDALRRCYILGEPSETILDNLRLTYEEFRAIRLRARTEFSTNTDHENVA